MNKPAHYVHIFTKKLLRYADALFLIKNMFLLNSYLCLCVKLLLCTNNSVYEILPQFHMSNKKICILRTVY